MDGGVANRRSRREIHQNLKTSQIFQHALKDLAFLKDLSKILDIVTFFSQNRLDSGWFLASNGEAILSQMPGELYAFFRAGPRGGIFSFEEPHLGTATILATIRSKFVYIFLTS
jgi:hypothetical protein